MQRLYGIYRFISNQCNLKDFSSVSLLLSNQSNCFCEQKQYKVIRADVIESQGGTVWLG
jgi:hypothetical protein